MHLSPVCGPSRVSALALAVALLVMAPASGHASLGDPESALSTKHIASSQGNEEPRRVGESYTVARRTFFSKQLAPGAGSGSRRAFILLAVLVNGRSQREEYWFDRQLGEAFLFALLDVNGGRTHWKKTEDKTRLGKDWVDDSSPIDERQSPWKQSWVRDDGKASLTAEPGTLVIWSDEYEKVEALSREPATPRF